MVYIFQNKTESGIEKYFTSNEILASVLSHQNYESVEGVDAADIVAHFVSEAVRGGRKINFSHHSVSKRAYRISNPGALDEYIAEAKGIMNLNPSDPQRIAWEEARSQSLKELDEHYDKFFENRKN